MEERGKTKVNAEIVLVVRVRVRVRRRNQAAVPDPAGRERAVEAVAMAGATRWALCVPGLRRSGKRRRWSSQTTGPTKK
jgi:hypothetical protein